MRISHIASHTRSLSDRRPFEHINYSMINTASRYYTYYYAAHSTGCGIRRMRV